MRGTVWKDAAYLIMARLARKGYSARQISLQLKEEGYDFTRNAVVGKCGRHKITLSGGRLNNAKSATKIIKNSRGGYERVTTKKIKSIEPQIVENVVGPPVPLLHLHGGMCKWPIGNPQDDGFGYCGKPHDNDTLHYCIEHHKRATIYTRTLIRKDAYKSGGYHRSRHANIENLRKRNLGMV